MDEQLPTLWTGEDADLVRSTVRAIRVEKILKEDYLQDVNGVYHAIGGFQRLAHTAHENPKWFYERYLKAGVLLPDEHASLDVAFHIHPALQRSNLDQPIEGEFAVHSEPHSGGDRVDDNNLDGSKETSPNLLEGRATSLPGSPGGTKDSSGENGGSLALALAEDKEAGRTG
jgi:hypothetical protein